MLLLEGSSALSFALLFCLSCLDSTVVLAFNLDTSHVIRKSGEPGTLFGFSLAMHRQLNPDKRMLLIGAPRARALGKQTANITGGLYKCEMSLSTDCERIEFDNEEDIRTENKENQWMGVTVQSQGPGGKIVTCAHRYQRCLFVKTPQESCDITGRCYILSQDLTIDSSSDEDGGNWNFCEGRSRGHEMFGSCQQGLAATFTKDYHYVVFGAPGAYNWKGIVRVEQKNNTLLEMGVYDDGPYEVGDENVLNPELVPVPANSYLGKYLPGWKPKCCQCCGFSLDSGYSITRSRGLTVVAGAPRANHSGAVLLLKKESEGSAKLSMEHILHGPGLASSFGYDVAVVDLNGDRWQDIVVGAPQFYMKDRDIGGAVYIYINRGGRWDKNTPIRLNGTKDSMFGLAVKNIGDINLDSYEDIAIGAPYDDSGAGKVYIYHGSSQGINTTPAQHNLQLFGYSLAGNMDLDSNSYPDLAVGSLSDTVLIYRARPIISIRRDVKISPQEIDLTIKTCGNSNCFTVEACFTYKANPASYSPRLSISYSVEADGDRRKQGLPSRVVFLNKSLTETDYHIKIITMTDLNFKQDSIKDKMRSIPIEVSTNILGTKRVRTKNGLPQLTPILDASQPSKDVNFVKEGCGSDQTCRSNLKMDYKLYYKENNLDIYKPLLMRNLALQVTVNNMNGDDAYEAKLVGTFPDILSYSGVRSHQKVEKVTVCIANQNGSQAECELGNPFKRDSQTTFYIILSTAGMTLDTTEIDIDLQLQTTSVQENIIPLKVKAQVIIELPLTVSGEASPNQVSFGGVVKGESAMKTEDEIGSLITYTFRINNVWKSLKSSVKASLKIQWPKYNKDGKWLLYLVKIKTTGPEIHCSPESEINPLKHIQVVCFKVFVFYIHVQKEKSALLIGSRGFLSRDALLQVKVTVSPESAVAQHGGVPWWIILIAVLAGILILALLVFLLWKCGFFKRSKQDDNVPRYHAVRIRKETPEYKDGNVKLDPFEKKQWMTTWLDNESYS
uniref:Integrin alpha-2 domain-containing protein n=1 Tax=Anabas testudineus TaxID=64144 RepID=A0A7N6A5N5_ANATE